MIKVRVKFINVDTGTPYIPVDCATVEMDGGLLIGFDILERPILTLPLNAFIITFEYLNATS